MRLIERHAGTFEVREALGEGRFCDVAGEGVAEFQAVQGFAVDGWQAHPLVYAVQCSFPCLGREVGPEPDVEVADPLRWVGNIAHRCEQGGVGVPACPSPPARVPVWLTHDHRSAGMGHIVCGFACLGKCSGSAARELGWRVGTQQDIPDRAAEREGRAARGRGGPAGQATAFCRFDKAAATFPVCPGDGPVLPGE